MSVHLFFALILAVVLAACAMDRPGTGRLDPDTPVTPGDDEPEPPAAAGPILVASDDGGDDLPAIGVADALRAEHGEHVVVRGALFEDPDGTVRLCDAIAESFPPQCGGDRVRVEGLDLEDVPGLQEANGVRWAESAQVFGSIEH